MGSDEPVVEQISRGMRFDRDLWEMALGETLFYGATEVPDTPVSFGSLRFLLGSRAHESLMAARSEWPWIERAVLGSRTFRLGRGVYRSQDAGWNGPAEAALLADKARVVDPASWRSEQLAEFDASLEEEDRADELALAQQALQQLRTLYQRATEFNYVVVCEQII